MNDKGLQCSAVDVHVPGGLCHAENQKTIGLALWHLATLSARLEALEDRLVQYRPKRDVKLGNNGVYASMHHDCHNGPNDLQRTSRNNLTSSEARTRALLQCKH